MSGACLVWGLPMALTRIRRPGHCQKSGATTGKRLFVEGGDGYSPWTRRWRDLIFAHVADLGGPDLVSEAEISLCRRASTLEVELEMLEARRSEGQSVDIELYGRLAGRLCRLLELVGIGPPA
jgi:hypothetical protein